MKVDPNEDDHEHTSSTLDTCFSDSLSSPSAPEPSSSKHSSNQQGFEQKLVLVLAIEPFRKVFEFLILPLFSTTTAVHLIESLRARSQEPVLGEQSYTGLTKMNDGPRALSDSSLRKVYHATRQVKLPDVLVALPSAVDNDCTWSLAHQILATPQAEKLVRRWTSRPKTIPMQRKKAHLVIGEAAQRPVPLSIEFEAPMGDSAEERWQVEQIEL